MDLKKLLQDIGLCDFFPGKLNRQSLFALADCNLTETKSPLKDLFSKFVNDLLHFDSNCRFIHQEVTQTTYCGFRSRIRNPPSTKLSTQTVHPLDLSTLLFLSCDQVARQDLVCRYFYCRHAFPFIVQLGHNTPPKLYAWPLRGIVAKFDENGLAERLEQAISKIEFKIVSFLRFSECDISKSSIINFVINRSSKGSSIFFHRNCTGSVKARIDVFGGMVEAFPYICSLKDGGPTIYLNLRGNAFNYKAQMHYILTISNISVILLDSKDLENVKNIISTIRTSNNNVKLLLLTDVSSDEIDEESISMFCEVENTLNVYLIPIKNLCAPDIEKEVTEFVYKTKDSILLESCVSKAREFEMNIDEDEMAKELDDAKKVSDIVAKRFEHRNEDALFPVQGKEYLKYASADKEFYKLRHIRYTDTVKSYRENLEKIKFVCRERQYNLTLNESIVSHFTDRYDGIHFPLFLRYLKLHFEHLTRVGVYKLLREYKSLFTTMRISESETQMVSWNNKLKELDEKMNSNALLISDFVREMAQIFESRTWFENRQQREVPAMVSAEVRCAVHVLLEGYPIELMDGRSNSVPLEWIKAVLAELKHVVGKSFSLKVISVLGVESSGKSTLLNIMFGCQFPVSSGRCTRGIYIYLLKVNPDKTNLDYVLVVDTEGLFSSAINLDDAGTRDQQERELATFVIGLSNITLVNVMGEDIHYLKDILPISVYAFLRMDLVGLNPKCKLLHHNVDNNRKQALGWQAKAFENVLDHYTKEACSMEKVECRQFKDVISFDPANDVYFFPSFLEANARETDFQDTVSNFYCQEVVNLNKKLLKDDSSLSLDELIHNIDRLWNAVKRENFVFEFRNMLEVEARTILDNKLCDLHWRVRTDIQVKTISFQERICKSSSVDSLIALREEIKADLEQYDKAKQEQVVLAFGRFYDEYDTALAKVLQKMWNGCRQDLQKITRESINEALSTVDRDIRLREREISFKQGDVRTVQCIEQYVEKHVIPETPNKNFNPEKCFEDWAVSELQTDRIMTKAQIEEDAIECLYVIYSTNRTAVDSIKPLLSYDLETFSHDKDHWPKEYDISKEEGEAAYQLVEDVKCYCAKVLDNIRCRKRIYKRTFFREFALFVKNERERLGRTLNARHTFDLELSAAACSYFIKHLVTYDTEKGLLSFNMMSSIKSFFVAKCLERKGGVTKTDYIVMGCCSSIENSIVEQLIGLQSGKTISGLTVHIITYMMDQYSFFHSKLGLLCFVWKRLLLDNDQDQLQHYLKHPLAVIRSTISHLFGTDISGIETDRPDDAVLLEKIIKPLVSDQIDQICHSLTSESTTKLGDSFDRIDKVLNFIVQKLEPYLDITDIYKYEHCRVEVTNADVFVQMIIQKLQSDVFRQCLESRIHYTILEKNMVHDDIRLQVVNSIYLNVIGCEETCTSCGVFCCSSQKCHAEAHSALIHMPIGFKDLFGDPTPISTATCFEVLEGNTIFENELRMMKWTTPCNESDEGNKFWKYMFATHICEMARKMGKIPPEVIPESWSRITKYEVLHWLEKQIEGQQDFKSISAC